MRKMVLRLTLIGFLIALFMGSASATCVTMTTDKGVYAYSENVTATLYSDTCYFVIAKCVVFDAGGSVIKQLYPHLVSNWPQQVDYYWDQTDSAGQQVPPGTYDMVAPPGSAPCTILGIGKMYGLSLKPIGSGSWKIAELVEIDLAAGAGTKIGAVGAGLDQTKWSLDLSFDSQGTLWAVDGTAWADNLVTIDTETGAGTVVASTGTLIEGIAFGSDGMLYAADSGANNWNSFLDALAIIDPVSFDYTKIGASGYDIDGLAFSPDGTLFGVDSGTLLQLDMGSGAAGAIGFLGSTGFYAITFTPDGIMYGALSNGDIYTIDPETAVASYVCSTGFPYLVGLEFAVLEMASAIDDYIQALPDQCFKNNADQRKNALHNKLMHVQAFIDAGDYQAAINKLSHDIRPKVDGEGKNDWITCPNGQDTLLALIDALIAYLQKLG